MSSDVSVQSKPAPAGARFFQRLLGPRLDFRFGAFEGAVFAVYVALLAWTLAHHVPHVDQAQAWLLARELSLPALFGKFLSYEGTPGLWHLILWFLCRLHVSYVVMPWIVAVIPVAGIWVFLRYSPFPAILRLSLPFSFYFFYQYAVVARSYIVLPLLVFLAAWLFAKPARNLVWIVVVLALMGNLSAHGFCISAGFAAMLAIRLWRLRKRETQFLRPGRMAAATACLIAAWGFAAWTARPTVDNRYTTAWYRTHHPNQFVDGRWATEQISVPNRVEDHSSDNDTTEEMNIREHRGVLRAFYRFVDAVTYGLSNSWEVSSVFVAVLLIFLFSRRNLLDFLPYILLQLLFEYVVSRAWHLGTVFVAIVGILWINWPREDEPHEPAWRGILTLALMVICVEQCFWTVHAIRNDMTGQYSGDEQAAAFLAGHIDGKKVAGFSYHSVGVLPFFQKNIFYNQPKDAFWYWSRKVLVDERALDALKEHPDYIDIGFAVHPRGNSNSVESDPEWIRTCYPDVEKEIVNTGQYVETHRFCGIAYSGHGYAEAECHVILEPVKH
jgi:hypothetical protein